MGQVDLNTNDMVLFLSHQVRTSLSSMLGYIEKLYDSQHTVKEKLTTLSKLRSILENTSSILEDAEHLASYEKGTFSVKSSQFSLEEELSETVIFLETLTRKSELKLVIDIRGQVPTVILSDALRLRQLVTQMVSLVIPQLDRGSLRLTLALSESEPKQLVFNIDSTGANFSENCFDEMMNSFAPPQVYALPSSHGQQAIAFPLINALSSSLGGKVSLEKSKMGRGFSLSASINPGPLDQLQLTDHFSFRKLDQSAGVRAITIPDFADKTFLFVEDDKDISSLFTHFLKQTGAKVEYALDGEEGLRLATHQPYDLIFLDLQIPKLNGLEVCTQLRKNGVETPVIALTSNTAIATKKKCMKAGFNLYLTKPLSIESLFQMIPKVVS